MSQKATLKDAPGRPIAAPDDPSHRGDREQSQPRGIRCPCGNQDGLVRELQRPDKRGRLLWVKSSEPGYGECERITCPSPTCLQTFIRTIGPKPEPADRQRWQRGAR